jgi:putative ABC transport system permease protein
MKALIDDLRYSIRILLKTPGFTAVAVLTLMLGIGGNTAIFSIINGVLINWGAAFKEPDKLVMVWKFRSDSGIWATTPADYRDWRDQAKSFDQIGAYYYSNFNLTNRGEPEKILGASITANLFPILGVKPAQGRTFLQHEEQWGSHHVVILSHNFWKSHFNNQNALGQTLNLSGDTYTVIGIMPPGAWFANTRAELWLPFAFAPNDPSNNRRNHFVYSVARLKQGVTLEAARSEMKSIARQLEQAYPENRGLSAEVTSLREQILGNVKPMLVILLAAVGFVLLISCANVANLLLVKAAHRKREMAIRISLGATGARLVRQLLCESILLSLLGGVLGLGLATWGVGLLMKLVPVNIPRIHEVAIHTDVKVLMFTIGLSVITGILFGLIPALQATKLDLNESLKESSRSSSGIHGRNTRNSLVISEVALALVLLAGAGLMIRSFIQLHHADLGIRQENVLTLQVELPEATANDAAKTATFFKQVLPRIDSLPGVVAAGLTSHLPVSGGGQTKYFTVDGRTLPTKLEDVPLVSLRQEGSNSFSAMGVQMRKGRAFNERDNQQGVRVAIINEALAHRFFPNEDPIGKQFSMEWPEHLAPPDSLPKSGRFPRWTIVGVAANVQYRNLNEPQELVVHVPYLQRDQQTMGWAPSFLVVRAKGDPLALAAAVRDQVWSVSRNQPVSNILTMEQLVQGSFKQSGFAVTILAIFAALALLLAALGIYGVMSYLVAQRTNEIGIRMALGANRKDVMNLILKHGITLAIVGVVIGIVASFALTRLMSDLLFGVSPTDPATFIVIPLVLIFVAFVSCFLPARSATKVDPIVALRYE